MFPHYEQHCDEHPYSLAFLHQIVGIKWVTSFWFKGCAFCEAFDKYCLVVLLKDFTKSPKKKKNPWQHFPSFLFFYFFNFLVHIRKDRQQRKESVQREQLPWGLQPRRWEEQCPAWPWLLACVPVCCSILLGCSDLWVFILVSERSHFS